MDHHGPVGLLDPLADLLLGACCPGCGAPGPGVCAQCQAAVSPAPRVIVDGPPPVVACLPYRAPLTTLVTAHKDRGAAWLGPLLGSWLATGLAAVVAAAETPPLLVPVPSSPASVRRRGADHALDLVRAAARACGIPRDDVQPLLRRTRRVQDQAEVSHSARTANQSGSMSARPGRGPVVVVDDIRTTGASLDEAVRALEAAGHRVLAALVLADAQHPRRWA